jgi:hypothetical protein
MRSDPVAPVITGNITTRKRSTRPARSSDRHRLTLPIVLDAEPEAGEAASAVAAGALTIHGVTNEVEIPIEARWTGDVIDVAGSLEIVLADYGMNAPERPFVSVDDVGTMELQLVFERAA